MSDADFLDSNVLLYMFDTTNASKRETASQVVRAGLDSGSAVISFQVVQETLNVMTRRIRPAATAAEARTFMTEVLVPLWRVMPSLALYDRALDVQARYQTSFYDGLIIAAALAAGCDRLLSEDLQHGQRVESLTIHNPFLTGA